ncbi:MAG: dethiobiotin synthase [Bacteroidota bacterium]
MQTTFFVTGINTEIGKTIASAILTQAIGADYWKPIQTGRLHHTDSDRIRAYVTHDQTIVHPEQFKLTQHNTPNAAAKTDGVKIKVKDFTLPKTKNSLIIEGTGGLLVPLNKKECLIDLINRFGAAAILVSMNYTGSINHTLLSIEALKNRKIPIAGILFNGKPTAGTEDIITKMAEVPILGRIPRLNDITKTSIKNAAEEMQLKQRLSQYSNPRKGKKLLNFFSTF